MMPMPQPPAIGRRAAAKPYSDIGASTSTDDASPHKLISLLYTTLLDDIHTARGAIQRGDVGDIKTKATKRKNHKKNKKKKKLKQTQKKPRKEKEGKSKKKNKKNKM